MIKTGVLLVNLGTPEAPSTQAVRRYLAEFLWDHRVVERPRWLWWLVLHGIILRIRPRRSAKLYQKIWTQQGSPLLVYSRQLAEHLEQALPDNMLVALGMRYGQPSIAEALQQLKRAKVEKIIVLPLYPQFSASTTATTFDAIAAELKGWRNLPELHFIRSYYQAPAYIDALVNSIKTFWQQQGRPQKLLISFHGLPQRYVDKGDPYYQECLSTASHLAQALGLASADWQLAFQSRLGPETWLQPYLDQSLKTLPANGIEHVQVVCPGFAVDCLETLEEVAIQNRELFLASGGKRYEYIPALNVTPWQVKMLELLVKQIV